MLSASLSVSSSFLNVSVRAAARVVCRAGVRRQTARGDVDFAVGGEVVKGGGGGNSRWGSRQKVYFAETAAVVERISAYSRHTVWYRDG